MRIILYVRLIIAGSIIEEENKRTQTPMPQVGFEPTHDPSVLSMRKQFMPEIAATVIGN
jgi:hypothetical protein